MNLDEIKGTVAVLVGMFAVVLLVNILGMLYDWWKGNS